MAEKVNLSTINVGDEIMMTESSTKTAIVTKNDKKENGMYDFASDVLKNNNLPGTFPIFLVKKAGS